MRDPEGRTPLFFAVAYNHALVVEELLRAGADIHFRVPPSWEMNTVALFSCLDEA